MSQLRVILQESVERERMHGIGRERRRRSFNQRLGFKGIGCCGCGGRAAWGPRANNMRVRDDDEEEEDADESHQVATVVSPVQTRGDNNGLDPECTETVSVSTGMNLAEALAAERHSRTTQEPEGDFVGPTSNETVNIESAGTSTPPRVSLMRLLEETEGGEAAEEEEEGRGGGAVGNELLCCVCMGRKKGAAFIPCGHTFCRVCSKELWLNRGFCPLCNRSILKILDIF